MTMNPHVAARMEVTSCEPSREEEADTMREEEMRKRKNPRDRRVRRRVGEARGLGTELWRPVRWRNRSMTMYMNDVHTMNTKNAYLEKRNPLVTLGSMAPARSTKKN